MQLTIDRRDAVPGDWPAIRSLLHDARLPAAELHDSAGFTVCITGERIVGAIALAPLGGGAGLLRSLAVQGEFRALGLGRGLVAGAEAKARSRGIGELFLLTDSAQAFFGRLGYRVLPRGQAPGSVRTHPQFTELCPASATLMHRRLDP